MIDIKIIRETPDIVEKVAKLKGVKIDIKEILEADKQHRTLLQEVQTLQAERNKSAETKNITEGKKIKERLKKLEGELRKKEEKLHELLLSIPNLPANDVKEGKDESENEVIKTVGKPSKFNFTPKDHLELGTLLDIINTKKAAEVSGTRFGYLKNEAVLIEFALIQFVFSELVKQKFIPIVPPALIKRNIAEGLGYFQGKENDEYYWVNEPDEKETKGLYLIGTAEHSIVPFHKNDLLEKKDLPKRYVGFSSAFRREAGSYGKDTRGIFRVHQFDKLEMISFVTEESDDKEHEYLLSLEENLFQALEVSYRIVKMCTADLGFPTARKYDIEAWIPSKNKYREVTSVSTVTDFQSRRLNIKYKNGGEKKYVHVLNGTAFAIGRTLIAILENFQQKDGSVRIPKVLQKYTGFDAIKPKR